MSLRWDPSKVFPLLADTGAVDGSVPVKASLRIRDGDHVKANVEGGPGFTGTIIDVDLDDGDVLIECDECGSNTAHMVPIADVRRIRCTNPTCLKHWPADDAILLRESLIAAGWTPPNARTPDDALPTDWDGRPLDD